MPTKKTDSGREYEVTGKRFIWHPLDDDDQVTDVTITIPLRMKMRVLEAFKDDELTPPNMLAMINELIPNQADVLRDMDVIEFQEMFSTWQAEYQSLSGASLGEASGSSE